MKLAGFITTGVLLVAALSFLIPRPMVDDVALVLWFGLLGWKIARLLAAVIAVSLP